MAELLVIGAHPDDAEIGMGGAIAAFVQQGHGVVILDLTNGEPTPMGSPEQRRAESEAAARVLGVKRRITLPLPNRYLMDTVENRAAVAEVIREVRPEIVFLPYGVDAHPDHVAAERLGEAARFYAKLTKTEMRGDPHYPGRILHFFCTHYRLHVAPAFILDITDQIAVQRGARQHRGPGRDPDRRRLLGDAHPPAVWGAVRQQRDGRTSWP
jgi:bacillithiol biosynthesis deacetylase BshB1